MTPPEWPRRVRNTGEGKDTGYLLTTDRLGMRRWCASDLPPFARMNRDPLVMQYFPSTLEEHETEAFIARIEQHFDGNGFGLYAVDLLSTGEFIGFIGLYTATFESDFTPCPEIGWRLHHDYWGNGYATEGATACLREGFRRHSLEEIFSFTAAVNRPSIAVMKRIGLQFRRSFQHPRIDPGRRLSGHVLYSLTRSEFEEGPASGSTTK